MRAAGGGKTQPEGGRQERKGTHRLSGSYGLTAFGNSLKMRDVTIIKAHKQGSGEVLIVLKSLSQ